MAFGEIGLDHSEPMKFWANQVELLQKLLPFLEDRHVLVIHCRGMHGDCGTEAFLLLLHFLRKYVRSHQPVHLHCFTGNKYVVERWLEVFPRTFFGITNLVNKFDDHQIQHCVVLKRVVCFWNRIHHTFQSKIPECRHQASYGP